MQCGMIPFGGVYAMPADTSRVSRPGSVERKGPAIYPVVVRRMPGRIAQAAGCAAGLTRRFTGSQRRPAHTAFPDCDCHVAFDDAAAPVGSHPVDNGGGPGRLGVLSNPHGRQAQRQLFRTPRDGGKSLGVHSVVGSF